MALIAGQGKFLGVVRGYQESDHGRGLRLAGCVALHSLSGRDDCDVLQNRGSLLLT